jgi:inorganic triphosphatase YgiF
MDSPKITESQRLMEAEIEKHTIRTTEADTDRELLNKIATNLNGKTEAIAKLRRATTRLIGNDERQNTDFDALRKMVEAHELRFQRFDELCKNIYHLAERIWREIKEAIKDGLKKALGLFITAVALYFLYRGWGHFFPNVPLQPSAP